jgi:hypothetical protein
VNSFKNYQLLAILSALELIDITGTLLRTYYNLSVLSVGDLKKRPLYFKNLLQTANKDG